jgi:DNA-binding MarR family transcriptional regulator
MSSNLNDSPNHFIVLNSISKNINTSNKIVKFTNLSKTEVDKILKELESQKLIVKSEKKSFIFGKKIQYDLTETAFKLLNAKNRELESKMKQVQQWYTQGDQTQVQSFMGSNRSWIPLMVASGIMDMLFFTSLMSFAGMSLNPMESHLMGNGGDSNTAASADQSSADNSDASSGSDAGSADFGDASGFDLGGGGFDSF